VGNVDLLCAESRVPLSGDVRLLLIAEPASVTGQMGDFVPMSLPIAGRYDGEGGVVLPEPLPAHLLALQGAFRTMPFDAKPKSRKLPDLLVSLRQGASEDLWARSNGRRISYVLLDAKVFDAMARSVERGGRPDWDASKRWYGQTTTALLSKAFPIPDLRTNLFGKLDAEQLEKLRFDIVAIMKLRLFGFRPRPIDVTGVDLFDGTDGGAPLFEAAKRRYAELPLLAAAVEAAETRWRARAS